MIPLTNKMRLVVTRRMTSFKRSEDLINDLCTHQPTMWGQDLMLFFHPLRCELKIYLVIYVPSKFQHDLALKLISVISP